MRRRLLLAHFASQPWALTPEYLALTAGVLARWSAEAPAAAEVMAKIEEDKEARASRHAQNSQTGAIAVIPIYGILTQRPPANISGPGATSTAQIAAQVRAAAADKAIAQILLDIDSPGGSIYGTAEAADAIYEARRQKPVTAIANSLAASAAYWLGAQASEFYATPGGEVGSIGVYTAHQYIGKALEAEGVETTLISAGEFKTEGNPFEPLGEVAKAAIDARVAEYYGMFIAAVARGRGVQASEVKNGMGRGRVLGAEGATDERMIDGISTFDQVLAKLQGSARPQRSRLASARRELALM